MSTFRSLSIIFSHKSTIWPLYASEIASLLFLAKIALSISRSKSSKTKSTHPCSCLLFIALGFISYDLVGGWDLLNESSSRISSLKQNLFNIKESYASYLSVHGTIKVVEILDSKITYGGIWTSSMILTFVFGFCGIVMSPSFSMLTFSSREAKSFGSQQVWLISFFIGFVLIFFITPIGIGSIFLGANNIINESGNNISNILPRNIVPSEIETLVPHLINVIGNYSPLFF